MKLVKKEVVTTTHSKDFSESEKLTYVEEDKVPQKSNIVICLISAAIIFAVLFVIGFVL